MLADIEDNGQTVGQQLRRDGAGNARCETVTAARGMGVDVSHCGHPEPVCDQVCAPGRCQLGARENSIKNALGHLRWAEGIGRVLAAKRIERLQGRRRVQVQALHRRRAHDGPEIKRLHGHAPHGGQCAEGVARL